jgi:hypothetical protein
MGPPALKPEFPDLEWTLLPASQRFATRHIQECNWLQGLEGGFDATHLSFLHGGDAEASRKIIATLYEVMPTDFGFIVGTGRDCRTPPMFGRRSMTRTRCSTASTSIRRAH